jgi:SAM-dependent methyltransferase
MNPAEQSGIKESRREHWETFWDEKQDVQEVYSNADRIVRNLLAVTDLRGKRILEIGAGTGRDSFPLVERGAVVYQLDYAENSLRILKRIAVGAGYDVIILGGDTFCLPFRDGSFDVVFHQGLLEHFRRPQAEALLRENIRVIKSGGYLLVDVPQRYHLYTLAKHLLIAMNQWFAGWERSFSTPELRNIFRSLGLVPVHSYGEWMMPGFFYRVLREVLKKAGITLPLYLNLKPFSLIRARIRALLLPTILSRYTGISIGVIGQKR